MGFNFGDFLKDLGGGIGDIVDAPFDAMKDISKDLTGLGGQIVKTGGSLGGELIKSGFGSLNGLVSMLPYIVVGGVVLLVVTKGGKSF
jgi:hypothetical protein